MDIPKVKIDLLEVFIKLSSLSVILAIITYMIISIAKMLLFTKPKHPLLEAYEDLRQLVSLRTITNFLPLMLSMTVFAVIFSYFKTNIPIVNPFSWDEIFMKADKILHFGNHPYELLNTLAGYPFVTFVLNIIYNIWFVVVWGFWSWLGLKDHNNAYRMRFMIAFFLVWSIGGSLLATIFSSAGPCFYGLLGNYPDIYKPLMSSLENIDKSLPIWAIPTQQMLWQSYTEEAKFFLGISAMPSMHNAAIDLIAIASFSYSRILGWVMSVIAVFIFIGSVCLGWHYAIDGYVGIVLAFVLWWFAGRILNLFNFGSCLHSAT